MQKTIHSFGACVCHDSAHETRKCAKGFTLIELSVVLVIIGLIVGAILVGQNLVQAAAVRKTISDLEKYKTAAQTFKGKYDCWPGDCANATTYFGVATNGACVQGQAFFQWWLPNTSGTCNGNGNVQLVPILDGSGYQNPGMGNTLFWNDLALANMIAGDALVNSYYGGILVSPETGIAGGHFAISYFYNSNPSVGYSNLGGVRVWQAQVEHNLFYLGYLWGVNILTPAQAYAIDTKIDDGLPGTGSVLGQGGGGGWLVLKYATGCTTTSVPTTAVYDLTKGDPACNMSFYAGF